MYLQKALGASKERVQEGEGTEGLEKGKKLLETLVRMWFTWENLSVIVLFNFHLAFSSFTRCRRPSIYWGRKSLKVAAVEVFRYAGRAVCLRNRQFGSVGLK